MTKRLRSQDARRRVDTGGARCDAISARVPRVARSHRRSRGNTAVPVPAGRNLRRRRHVTSRPEPAERPSSRRRRVDRHRRGVSRQRTRSRRSWQAGSTTCPVARTTTAPRRPLLRRQAAAEADGLRRRKAVSGHASRRERHDVASPVPRRRPVDLRGDGVPTSKVMEVHSVTVIAAVRRADAAGTCRAGALRH